MIGKDLYNLLKEEWDNLESSFKSYQHNETHIGVDNSYEDTIHEKTNSAFGNSLEGVESGMKEVMEDLKKCILSVTPPNLESATVESDTIDTLDWINAISLSLSGEGSYHIRTPKYMDQTLHADFSKFQSNSNIKISSCF